MRLNARHRGSHMYFLCITTKVHRIGVLIGTPFGITKWRGCMETSPASPSSYTRDRGACYSAPEYFRLLHWKLKICGAGRSEQWLPAVTAEFLLNVDAPWMNQINVRLRKEGFGNGLAVPIPLYTFVSNLLTLNVQREFCFSFYMCLWRGSRMISSYPRLPHRSWPGDLRNLFQSIVP